MSNYFDNSVYPDEINITECTSRYGDRHRSMQMKGKNLIERTGKTLLMGYADDYTDIPEDEAYCGPSDYDYTGYFLDFDCPKSISTKDYHDRVFDPAYFNQHDSRYDIISAPYSKAHKQNHRNRPRSGRRSLFDILFGH